MLAFFAPVLLFFSKIVRTKFLNVELGDFVFVSINTHLHGLLAVIKEIRTLKQCNWYAS